MTATLVAGLTACTGTRPSPFGDARDLTIQIDVRNLNFADATLHAHRSGQRIRLGIVTGKSRGSFTVPWRISRSVRIEIDLLAGPRCMTPEMVVGPGDIVEVEIQASTSLDPYCISER